MATILTHNGFLTVSNPATGEHRTFRVRTQADDAGFAPGRRVIGMLTGPDNENDYEPFGFVDDRGVYVWRKKATPFFLGVKRILERPERFAASHGLTYQFETRCRKCNRTLTTPESVESGIGPVCAGRAADDEGDEPEAEEGYMGHDGELVTSAPTYVRNGW